MRTKLAVGCTVACIALVTACSGENTRTGPLMPGEQGIAEPQQVTPAALSDDDYCIQGITIASPGDQVRATIKPIARRSGGFDYAKSVIAAYLAADGNSVIALRGTVEGLCNGKQRLPNSGQAGLTTQQLTTAYGEPARRIADGDKEYWIYSAKSTDQAMIFMFSEGKAKTVYITSMTKGARQWYPLLGDIPGPQPMARKDAAVGPLTIGMPYQAVTEQMGSKYDEGALPPYSKYVYKGKGVEVQVDDRVRALFLGEGSTFHTPRGIHVGSSASDLLTAYGEARALTTTTGERIWSYENLKDGVGLIFWLKDNTVVRLAAWDETYQFRTEVR